MRAMPIVTTRMGPGQRTMAVPMRRQPLVRIGRAGSNRPKWRPMLSTAGARVRAATNATRTPVAAGMAMRLEIRKPGEVQTEHRAGNRQARAQNDVCGPVVHRREGRNPILPDVTRFVVPAENEDGVIGSGGDDQQSQNIGRVLDSPIMPAFARTATTPRDAVNSIITVKITRIAVVKRR